MKLGIISFFDFWFSDFEWYRNLQPKYHWYKATTETNAGIAQWWFKDTRNWDDLLKEFERIESKLK